ncbi:protein-serine O-palmitoleoyltransferase porcupine [Drosophila kikkawai]|uniref:Protein-serine O-palmitoleoyltransferase porcupine n=1 Tax=Drosophila kikkawai TaxID=30033 RepID=A0A6P4J208_DROKI|nr:protein-serine O-palmitoleoyltransferase porcupine [Drosophila kikkawai]
MDYQYYDEESDYIDVDEEELAAAGGLDYGYGKPLDEEVEDYYLGGGEDEEAAYHNGGLVERLPQILHSCVKPSLLQVLQYMAPMLLLCLVCRLLCLLYARRGHLSQNQFQSLRMAPLHLIHLGCGLTLLHFSVGYRLWLLLLLAVVGYLLLQLLRLGRHGAQLLAMLTIGSQFLYELLIWRNRSDWPQLRGIQMVVNMKLISLGFDLTSGGGGNQLTKGIPNPLAYLGYIYSPATCALGPWVSYGSYSNCLVPRSSWLLSLRRTVANAVLCLLTVTVSNCLAPLLSDLAGGWHFLAMYTDALSVRSSHYFVGFIAQALLVVTDQRLDDARESELLGPLVAQPWRIEWPRSISALVRSWNIPMHEWLKRYIYTPCKTTGRHSRMQGLLAIFCTYLVSSLLHGMDLRIYLVLISLAVFAAGESLLRRHLSSVLNACLSANLCPGAERCRYSNCPSKLGSWASVSGCLVQLANLGFTALAIFHLAYLGVVLMGDSLESGVGTAEEEGFLWHWKQAGYLSHYIGVGTIVLYLFIS